MGMSKSYHFNHPEQSFLIRVNNFLPPFLFKSCTALLSLNFSTTMLTCVPPFEIRWTWALQYDFHPINLVVEWKMLENPPYIVVFLDNEQQAKFEKYASLSFFHSVISSVR